MSPTASSALTDEFTDEHVGFELALTNFSGPFDLLLSLIARRRMDITDVALAEVTDEFLAYVTTLETTQEVLENSTAFMVVAATLLELKTARLLPSGIADTHDDMALLEERDLLFARLLQYRAFKQAAEMIHERLEHQTSMVARHVTPERQYATLLPEVVVDLSAPDFAALAQDLFTKFLEEPDDIATQHLHDPVVLVSEQVAIMRQRIAQAQQLTFRELVQDAATQMVVVVRFLGLLIMYRDQLIEWHQETPLGNITVVWRDAA